MIRKRLTGANEIYFDQGIANLPILSPRHYWDHMSTKYGPSIQALRQVKEQGEEMVALRKDFLKAIEPYIYENELKIGYLLTTGIRS